MNTPTLRPGRSATQAEADKFAAHMCRHFFARVLDKSKASEMRLIGQAFDVAREFGAALPPGHDFARYSTTLGPLIYLAPGLSPDAQIGTITHECEHVRQGWAHNLEFAWLYLTEPEARVRYEGEAYASQFLLEWARFRSFPDLEHLTLPLEQGYALGPDHTTLGRVLLEQHVTSMVNGFPGGAAGLEAVRFLRAELPELLAS